MVSSAFNELRRARRSAARSVAALAETPPLAQTRYQPRPQAHARYAALYPVYRLLREQMLPVWQARQAFNLFLRTYNHENRFTAEHAGDLSAFHQLGELLVEGGRWANRNSAPVS